MSDSKFNEPVRVIARILLCLCQFAAVAYVTLLAWLMSGWFANDSWAAGASDADWLLIAGQRAAAGLLAAALVGGILLGVNHLFARWRLTFPMLRPTWIAWIGAATVGSASLVGAITFDVVRPFM